MSAPETSDFGPYAFSLTADEARIAAARAGLRRALAGGLTAAHFAPLAAFVLAILFIAILALTGLLGRRSAEAALLVCAAAFLAQRLADAAPLLRQPTPRRSRDRALARRRAARAQRRSRRAQARRRACAEALAFRRLPRGRGRRRPRLSVAAPRRAGDRADPRLSRRNGSGTLRAIPAIAAAAPPCRVAGGRLERASNAGAGIDAHRDDWRRLCRLGLGGLFRRLRSRRRLRRQGRRQGRGAQGRPIADLRTGPERTRRRQPARRPAVVHRRHSRRDARRAGGLHLRRHADDAGRRRRRHALRLSGGARNRRSDRRLRRRRQQVDLADRRLRRNRAHPRRTRAARVVRRRLQSGVPARRRGDRRFQAARPGGDRRRGRRCAARDARNLPAARAQRQPDRLYDAPHRRADQIRRQRLSGDEGHLHQRDGRPMREGRRRRDGRRPRRRPRQAHRPPLPQPRPRLRRLVLSRRTRWR